MNVDSVGFWDTLDQLIATSEIVIDRPKGTGHPRYHDIIYPLDYGYLAGTSGGDGNEIDVWRGTGTEGQLDAVVCTADKHKRDTEVKLLIGCSVEERRIVHAFHRDHEMGVMLIEREQLG